MKHISVPEWIQVILMMLAITAYVWLTALYCDSQNQYESISIMTEGTGSWK